MYKTHYWYVMLIAAITCASTSVYAQNNFKAIALPPDINNIDEQFSGMTMYDHRLYLLPQYGDNKKLELDKHFTIYSILADSIGRVIDGKDQALTRYRPIRVTNLEKLKSVVNHYQGFEAITIVDNTVFLSIETSCYTDKSKFCYDYCYILKGKLNATKNEIIINTNSLKPIKRPFNKKNAGFESLTYLPTEKKLLAYYEYNGSAKGGIGYLIDTGFANIQPVNTPFLPDRITDIAATSDDKIYGINFFYGKPPHEDRSYGHIVMLNKRTSMNWITLKSRFPILNNNWEGIALYRKGALLITDANNNPAQLSTFGYVKF